MKVLAQSYNINFDRFYENDLITIGNLLILAYFHENILNLRSVGKTLIRACFYESFSDKYQ